MHLSSGPKESSTDPDELVILGKVLGLVFPLKQHQGSKCNKGEVSSENGPNTFDFQEAWGQESSNRQYKL